MHSAIQSKVPATVRESRWRPFTPKKFDQGHATSHRSCSCSGGTVASFLGTGRNRQCDRTVRRGRAGNQNGGGGCGGVQLKVQGLAVDLHNVVSDRTPWLTTAFSCIGRSAMPFRTRPVNYIATRESPHSISGTLEGRPEHRARAAHGRALSTCSPHRRVGRTVSRRQGWIRCLFALRFIYFSRFARTDSLSGGRSWCTMGIFNRARNIAVREANQALWRASVDSLE